jgi:hypothetical protein
MILLHQQTRNNTGQYPWDSLEQSALLTLPRARSAVLNSLRMPPTSDVSADRFINLPNLRCTFCIVTDDRKRDQNKKQNE